MSPEIRIIQLESENRRLWATRLCWDNGVRLCDTDRGPDYSCGKPATMVWLDPRHDDFFFCGQDCVDYVLYNHGGSVREIGKAHDLVILEYTPEPDEEDIDDTAKT